MTVAGDRASARKYKARVMALPEHRAAVNSSRIELRTGMSEEMADALRVTQGGACAICAVPMTARDGKLPTRECRDHRHEPKTPRALLCCICNTALGFYEQHQRGRITLEVYETYLARFDK